MDSIYSKIIWDELGMRDYELHKEPPIQTEQLVLDWVRNSPKEKVDEVLADISWITEVKDAGYFDGTFLGINQRTEEERQVVNGELQNDLTIHEIGVLPTLLFLALKTNIHPDELRFIANILEIYDRKLK